MLYLNTLPKIQGKYRQNVNIGQMCWFKTNAIADVLYIPKNIDDLQHFLMTKPSKITIYIIGIGSNLLIRDGGIRGIVILLRSGFNSIVHIDNIVKVGCACLDLNVAYYAVNNSISGLEFFAGIPGTIGGALATNAGAYGNDISSVLIKAKAINILTGKRKIFYNQEIGYQYRSKKLNNEWLFYEAILQGTKGNKDRILELIQDIQKKRSATQPIRSKTGGSTFKNPPNCKAWRLIDQCGLRGIKIGDAVFSDLHANFLINKHNATAKDLEDLIILASKKVKKLFNINLEQEIKIIGDYR